MRPTVFLPVPLLLAASVLAATLGGAPLAGLTREQGDAFTDGLADFTENEHAETGLGPVMNAKSCGECHAAGGLGGSSPDLTNSVVTRFATRTGGRFDPLTVMGGPVLQRRSIREERPSVAVFGEVVPPQGTLVSHRQTPPLFGAGLIDAIPASVILAREDPADRNGDGISGRANRLTNPETGRVEIGRFGWKADVSSLHVFAGLAYVNEIGITNPTFPHENLPQGRPIPLGADLIPELEDEGTDTASLFTFMRFLAPLSPRLPLTGSSSSSTGRFVPPSVGSSPVRAVAAGETVFTAIGCASCHTPRLTTGGSEVAALRNRDVSLFSDLLLHDMGAGLADGMEQESAGGGEWRTAPLWGLSRRLFFLHDGRARDVSSAIFSHGGEGAAARRRFQDLTSADREALLAFLGNL